MIPSPSKRRKSNSSIPIPVGVSNTTRKDGRGRTSPSRSPSRRSFQAPTRSSLARYHPDVLSRVVERSTSEKARRPSEQDFSSFGEHGHSSPQISGKIPLRLSLTAATRTETEAEDGLPQLNSTISRPSSRRRSFGEQLFSGEITRKDEPTTQGERRVSPNSSTGSSHQQGHSLSPPAVGPEQPPRGTIAQFSGSPSQPIAMKKKQQLKKAGFHLNFKTKNPRSVAEDRGIDESPAYIEIESKDESLKEKKKLRESLKAQLERLKGEVALLEREAGRLESAEYELADESSLRLLVYVISLLLHIPSYQLVRYTNTSDVVGSSYLITHLVLLLPLRPRHLHRCLPCFHICFHSRLRSISRRQTQNHPHHPFPRTHTP